MYFCHVRGLPEHVLNQFHGQLLNSDIQLDMMGQTVDMKVFIYTCKNTLTVHVKLVVLLYLFTEQLQVSCSFYTKIVYSGMLQNLLINAKDCICGDSSFL